MSCCDVQKDLSPPPVQYMHRCRIPPVDHISMRVCVAFAVSNQRDCELGGLRTPVRHGWFSVKAGVLSHGGCLSCLY